MVVVLPGERIEDEVVAAQRAAYDGRSVEEPPSIGAAIDKDLEENEAAGVKAFSFAGLANAMTSALGGSDG